MSEHSHILRFLKKHHVLSLCATDSVDFWCANCFYIFNEKEMVFWLMTESNTRHGRLMIKNPQICGTIYVQSNNVFFIKGLQYSGRIIMLPNEQALQVSCIYQKRFPISKKFEAPLWEIVLNYIKMTNNTLGFAKKIIWKR